MVGVTLTDTNGSHYFGQPVWYLAIRVEWLGNVQGKAERSDGQAAGNVGQITCVTVKKSRQWSEELVKRSVGFHQVGVFSARLWNETAQLDKAQTAKQ